MVFTGDINESNISVVRPEQKKTKKSYKDLKHNETKTMNYEVFNY